MVFRVYWDDNLLVGTEYHGKITKAPLAVFDLSCCSVYAQER